MDTIDAYSLVRPLFIFSAAQFAQPLELRSSVVSPKRHPAVPQIWPLSVKKTLSAFEHKLNGVIKIAITP